MMQTVIIPCLREKQIVNAPLRLRRLRRKLRSSVSAFIDGVNQYRISDEPQTFSGGATMKHSQTIAACLLACVTALLLGACAGSGNTAVDEGSEKDRSFSYDSLRSRGLLVAGVFSHDIVIAREDRVEVGTTLAEDLRSDLGDGKPQIYSAEQLVGRLGEEKYISMMRNCDREGMLTEEDILVLSQSLATPPYILLADLVDEKVNDQNSTEWENSGKGGEYVTSYNTRYFLRVEFQIYDAIARKMVWRNTFSNEVERTEKQGSGSNCTESCLTQIFTLAVFGSPAKISRREAIEDIIERCASNLRKARAE
jgi:hypothetical protein